MSDSVISVGDSVGISVGGSVISVGGSGTSVDDCVGISVGDSFVVISVGDSVGISVVVISVGDSVGIIVVFISVLGVSVISVVKNCYRCFCW